MFTIKVQIETDRFSIHGQLNIPALLTLISRQQTE